MERRITVKYPPAFKTIQDQILYFEKYRVNLEMYLDETFALNGYARIRIESEVVNTRRHIGALRIKQFIEEHGHYPDQEKAEPTISDWGKVG